MLYNWKSSLVGGECIRHESGIEFEIIDGDARRIRKVKIRRSR